MSLLMGALLGALPAPSGAASGAQARAATARPADAARAARALEGRLNALRGVTARFTQTLESAALPSAQIEEGTVYLQRPGRMRWEYRKPPGKLAVADGERSWLFLPDDRQVLVAPLPTRGHDQGIGLLLRDRIDVLAEFEPEWGPPLEQGGPPSLVLRPRTSQASFERLSVGLDASDFPVRLTVVDPLGGSITYAFSDLRFVERLDEDLFRFTPPPGMSVQEVEP